MNVTPVILDCQTVGQEGAPVSLLSLPLGAGSFLDHIAGELAAFVGEAPQELLVVPTFRPDEDYGQRLGGNCRVPVHVVEPDDLDSVIEDREAADYLLVVDAARWPAGAVGLAGMMRENGHYRGATHLIAIGADGERTRERVHCDEDGRVRQVERLYDRITWPDAAATGVFLTLMPARTGRGLRLTCLPDLRFALSASGVLSRDLPVAVDPVDLSQAAEVLALNERVLAEGLPGASSASPASTVGLQLVGPGCQVDASARLIGPVVLHDGVTVEADAVIVGPTVVGSGSLVQRGATVAQSVLASGTVVTAGAGIRQCLASGVCSKSSGGSGPSIRSSCRVATPASPVGAGYLAAAPAGVARAHQRFHSAVKRAIDAAFAAVALLVLSPLLLVVALVIRLESPGPVLFVHRRERRGGREFGCLKFRTMVADAHRQQRALYKQNELDGPQFKLQNDPRVTRVGAWLRVTNIDELPQLINVLLGHMSLVGPRPSPFRENQICVPWRRARLSVQPGITGLWQVCRSDDRTAGDFHEWVFYDIAYVRHFSIWLDFKILLATVLTGGGRWQVPLSWLVRGGAVEPSQAQEPAAA